MKKFMLCCALVLSAVLALPLAGAAAAADATLVYDSNGYFGCLTIIGAEGTPYSAFDSTGRMVSCGVATQAFYQTPIMGAASGGLVVMLDRDMLYVVDRDGEWQ